MKALLCTRLGGPDGLIVDTVANPAAGPGQAVVKIQAAALNFFDTLIIAGKYQVKPELPFSPAAEFAGVVESIGPGVTAVGPGDRVAGNLSYGAARERIARTPGRIALVGVSPMTERAAVSLAAAGLDFTVVNRSVDKAAALAARYGAQHLSLEEFRAN